MARLNQRSRRRRNRPWISDRTSTLLLIGLCIIFPLLFCAFPVHADEVGTSKNGVGPVIGIDLGTTNSCVAVQRNGQVEIIPNGNGDRTTPSYVSITENGQRLIGLAAKNRSTTDTRNTVFDIKRVMGLPFSDPTVQENRLKYFPFKLTSRNSKPVVEMGSLDSPEFLSPEQISATILSHLKANAEAYLQEPVTQAVISVPAWFNDAQRAATKAAGKIAGLEVLRLINEPTAAALAYGLDTERDSGEHLLVVYDLGGGTFDVSVIEQEQGVFEVLATGGDTHLGGEDFDNRIIEHFAHRWNALYPDHDITKDNTARAKLREEAERAKRRLSEPGVTSTSIEITAFKDGIDFFSTLTRAEFDEINEDLFQKTLHTLEAVIKDSKRDKIEMEDIVLIGGSTRVPRIRELLQNYFPDKTLRTDINPDEAVAMGAAKVGSILNDDSPLLGLIEVNPLSLGVDTNGLMTRVIVRNTIIPTRRSKMFTTTTDNQEAVTIRVLEGERAEASANNYLGQLTLSGITPAPKGAPQIEVTFELDANGILVVKAVDKLTGKSAAAEITNRENRLSYEEVERMVEDSERYAERDQNLRDIAEATAYMESLILRLRSHLEKPGLDKSAYRALQSAIEEAMNWSNDHASRATLDEIKKRTEALLAEYDYYKGVWDKQYAHVEL